MFSFLVVFTPSPKQHPCQHEIKRRKAHPAPSAAQYFTIRSDYDQPPIAQTGRARAPRAPQTKSASATKPVGRAPRARRKQPTTQPTSAVQNPILPWPILPATSAPSCDSRHRLVSCTNPQARISTPATDAFPARTTTTRCHRKIPPTGLPKLLQLLHLSHSRHSLPDQSEPSSAAHSSNDGGVDIMVGEEGGHYILFVVSGNVPSALRGTCGGLTHVHHVSWQTLNHSPPSFASTHGHGLA